MADGLVDLGCKDSIGDKIRFVEIGEEKGV